MPDRRDIDVDEAARLTTLGETGPVAIQFVPAMDAIACLRPEATGDGTVHALWLWPLDGQPPRRLVAGAAARFTPAESLRRERARLVRDGVTAFEVVAGEGGPVFLVRVGGDVLIGGADGPFAPWPGLEESTLDDARLLPGGRRLIYVTNGELGLADADGRRRVLARADASDMSVGLADYIAAEELGRQNGLWPDRDGRRLLFARVDNRPVPPYEIVHQAESPTWTERIPYPFAGAANALVELFLVDLADEAATPRLLEAVGPDRYLARVDWTAAGEPAALLLDRDQHAWRWQVYPDAGRPGRTLAAAAAPHWLPVPAVSRFLADGGMLLTQERDGHDHLLRVAPDGRRRPLTGGDWDVTALLDLDEARAEAVLQVTAALGTERHLVRVGIDDATIVPIVTAAATATAVVAPEHDRFVLGLSSRAHPTWTRVVDRDGRHLLTLDERPAEDAAALGLVPPTLVRIPADDGTVLNAALYLPEGNADGDGARAAVVSVYGGPHAQRVREDWTLTADLRAQHLAQRGFVVLKLDNRGSDGRGPAFARALEHAFATVELDDQVRAVAYLVERHGVDPARVGMYGWSYGGYLTLHALMRRPDVFAAGVSGAPVTDFARYDTAYTERHLGTPTARPEVYAQASALAQVPGLVGDLLILHGLVDENVHFAHSARLVQALYDAGRPFELSLLPTSRHMPRDPATRRFIERRTVSFLVEHLRPGR